MPNKAISKAQFRLFKGTCEGSMKKRPPMSREKACEMVGHQSPKGLPERKAPPRKKRPPRSY